MIKMTEMKKGVSVFTFLFFSVFCFAQNIIPQPVTMKTLSGSFPITKTTTLIAKDAEDRKTASIFNDYLQQVYGFKLPIKSAATKNHISFATLKFIKAPEHEEGYSLNVTKNGVNINGNSYAGTFYGMETLIQLLPADNVKPKASKLAIPITFIEDYPRFAYRGMHLDVGRHFFPASFVKKIH